MKTLRKSLSAVTLALIIGATSSGCGIFGEQETLPPISDSIATQSPEDFESPENFENARKSIVGFFSAAQREMIKHNAGDPAKPITKESFPESYSFMDTAVMHDEDIVSLIRKNGDMFAKFPEGTMEVEPSALLVVKGEATLENGSIDLIVNGAKTLNLAGVNLQMKESSDGKWLIYDQAVHAHE